MLIKIVIIIFWVAQKFSKQCARVGDVINKALVEYKEEVTNGSFPGTLHSPYKISEIEINGFISELQGLGFDKAAASTAAAGEKIKTAGSSNGPANDCIPSQSSRDVLLIPFSLIRKKSKMTYILLLK
ncbi:hypothetical protein NC652_006756 [Populus alba x Populus x berolinensis]|nr:hypothetical protein NC652_006756 [Populus alba x Populus x berolinensis]